MSNLPRILVCHPLHPAGVERLRQAAIVDIETSLSSDDLQAIIGQYQAIIVGPNMRLPHYVIEAGYNLRVIGCAGSRLHRHRYALVAISFARTYAFLPDRADLHHRRCQTRRHWQYVKEVCQSLL